MTPPRGAPLAALLLALTMTAACGSTVQGTGAGGGTQGLQATTDGLGGDGLGGDGFGGDAQAPGSAGAIGDAGSQAGGAGLPGSAAALGGAAGTGGAAGAAGQPAAGSQGAGRAGEPAGSGAAANRVLGVTDKTIKFGASYTQSQGAQNALLGAGGLDEGDARRFYEAVAKQINDEGGVAGRKLVPSYFDAAGYDDVNTLLQAACEKWTNDDPAFVILDGNSDILRQCAKKAGIINLATGASNSTARTFVEYPHYFEPNAVRLDRATGVTVEGLARTDYYGKAPVIGIVAWDDPDYRRAVEGTMVPALRKLRHAPTQPQYVTVPESEAGLGDSSAAVNSAILKMRSDGVTHVFIVDGPAGVFAGTGLTLLFIRSARGQNWVPRYGFGGANNAQSGMDAGLWSADDIKGSRAVSTSNTLDGSDAGTTPNRQRIACLDLMKRSGVDYTDPNARAGALGACEYLWFVKRVLGSTFGPVNREVFLRNVNALGTSYASPYTYRTRFAPDRHDGAAAARTLALDESGCSCFVYTSKPYTLP